MGAGIHVRVHADRHRGLASHGGGDGGKHFHLLRAFGVDLEDAGGERGADLGLALADAGEDAAGGADAGGLGDMQLPAADHVGADALGAQQAQHGKVVVGLHGVVDRGVEPCPGQGLAQRTRPAAERAGGIDPDRAAHPGRDGGERHFLQAQPVLRMGSELRPLRQQLGKGRVRRLRGQGKRGSHGLA